MKRLNFNYKKFRPLFLLVIFLFIFIFACTADTASAAKKRGGVKNPQNSQNSKNSQNSSQTQSEASSSDVNYDKDMQREIAIGRKALAQIEQQWPLTSDPAVTARLTMILNRLEPHMQRRLPYEIRLVRTEVKNAFCLPGGFIFFTTGILDLLKTDAELAAVMAHEMIHADRKHGLRMAAEGNKITLGALAVMLLSRGAAAPIILAQVAQIAIMNSYTIELETEADSLGLDALIASGYPPGGMVTLMEKFLNEEMKEPIREYGIYMNHPDSPKRLQSALNKLNKLGIPVQRKYPLGLLRTSIHRENNNFVLLIDNEPAFSIKDSNNKENLKIMQDVKQNIDKYFQLELVPYDIHTANNALYIGNNKIASAVSGMNNENMETFRKNLLKILDNARRRHPAKYFK